MMLVCASRKLVKQVEDLRLATLRHSFEEIKLTDSEIANWKMLCERARAVTNARKIGETVTCGEVGAAVQTTSGNVYTGICVDTACTLGICAERNAIFNMLTNGESEVAKIVCVMGDKIGGSPCGACRELLTQICGKRASQVEILMDENPMRVVTLKELCPEWWLEVS